MDSFGTVSDHLQMFGNMTVDELKNQTLVLFNAAGTESTYFYNGELDELLSVRLISAIHAAIRIAAAVIVAVVLALCARGYRSPLFIIYQFNFMMMLLGSALQLSWLFSFNASITEYITLGGIPRSSLNLSVAATIFQVLLIISLLASLVMQIYFACSDLHRWQQFSISGISAIGCLPAYLIWIWRMVLVCIQDLGPNNGGGDGFFGVGSSRWIFYGAWPSFAASTAFCSVILCAKLWMVQRHRVQIGVEAFNPVRVLLTMALQNSVIPAILAIISASMSQDNIQGQSIAAATVPITAVMLPIGYIWAQVSNTATSAKYLQQQSQYDVESRYPTDTSQKSEKHNGSLASPFSARTEHATLVDSDKFSY